MVGALVVAGLTVLWMLLGGVSALWVSGYGRWFIVKLLLVGCLVCLAGFNRL